MLKFYHVYRQSTRKMLGSALCLALLLIPLASCSLTSPSQIQAQLQSKMIDLAIPAAAMNSPVLGRLADNTTLHVRVTFKIDSNVLNQLQQQKVQPGQPSHAEQLASKIGISENIYQKIKVFFSARGIALQLNKLRTHLSVDAHASILAKVFQTQFVVHKYNGQTFYAPDKNKPPQGPQALVDSIDAITGLDNYSVAPTHQLSLNFQTPARHLQPGLDCSPQTDSLFPREVAHAYGFDQLWNQGWHGENKTINLVEIDGSYSSDIQNYFGCINFKGHFSTINVDGHPRDALGESTLDIQMVAGLARSSTIKVYQTDVSNSNDDVWAHVNDELQRILDDNVNNTNAGNVVSLSLGASEGDMTGSMMRAIDSSIRQLVQVEHMVVFSASGDCGAFNSSVYGQLAVSFPASDPWVVSVGGTILQIDQNNNRAREVAWSDSSDVTMCKNSWGSGGGNSSMFQRMGWQSAPGVNNQYSDGKRQIPDVSAVAYALAVYFNGQWGIVGGTSAAAPIWATGFALVNQGLEQKKHTFDASPDVFYQVDAKNNGVQPYYDIVRGDNLYYRATPGWDYASGLGTPNLPGFYRAVSALIK